MLPFNPGVNGYPCPLPACSSIFAFGRQRDCGRVSLERMGGGWCVKKAAQIPHFPRSHPHHRGDVLLFLWHGGGEKNGDFFSLFFGGWDAWCPKFLISLPGCTFSQTNEQNNPFLRPPTRRLQGAAAPAFGPPAAPRKPGCRKGAALLHHALPQGEPAHGRRANRSALLPSSRPRDHLRAHGRSWNKLKPIDMITLTQALSDKNSSIRWAAPPPWPNCRHSCPRRPWPSTTSTSCGKNSSCAA